MSEPCGVLRPLPHVPIGNPGSILLVVIPRFIAMEDHEMFAQRGMVSRLGRATALATVAAVALTAVAPSLAAAAPAQRSVSAIAGQDKGAVTDVSARRRVYRHYHGGGGGAAAAAA